jgi:drug/metabolite transporter (DMT)-like permease
VPLALVNVPSHLPSGGVIASLLALGLGCTALGFLTYFSLIGEVGATRASLITYVNPAVAVVLGVAVLQEPMTAATLMGCGLIWAGCWLSSRGGPSAAEPEPKRSAGAVRPRMPAELVGEDVG